MVALRTFINLSPERQKEIIENSLKEFALNEYQTASISNIVTDLGIAKGSFYRYFESKKALYFYLIDYCIKSRLKNDQEIIITPQADFFELMIQHLLAKMKFDKNFPLESAFLYNVLQEKNSDELGNIQLTIKLKAIEAIKPFVKKAYKEKIFKPELNIDLISFSVYRMQFSILEYLEIKFKIDFRENIKNRKPYYDIPEKELIKTAKKFIEIFKTGIQNTTL